jgi:hypothetical protein
MRGRGFIQAAARQALEIAHRIVGRIAHQSAQQGNAGNLRRGARRARQSRAQDTQKLLLGFGSARLHAADVDARGLYPHFQAIAETNEGISCQPFASFDAFKQEPGPKRRELQIGGNRRIKIGCDVKRWFHLKTCDSFLDQTNVTGNKKPITTCERRWVLDKREIKS